MSIIHQILPYSLFLSRLLASGRVNQQDLEQAIAQPLSKEFYSSFTDWQQLFANQDEAGLKQQLRLLRSFVVAHIIVRDLAHISNLEEVTRTITELADFAILQASEFADSYYQKLYGEPIGHYSQTVQKLSVVAMGKMGGYELNVSSDIDLIFVYAESGDTNGKREKSNQDFFTKVGQKIISILNDITAEGQVFRVDMRLRPDGDSGALVLSETALEQYLITQGREWERYAWIKARIVTPYANNILTVVRPFIYRKYFDFNAYESMRDLHQQIRQEVSKKGMDNNIKLGAGGIREIEFTAQIFQLIRGGQKPELQLKGTQETLHKLAQLELISEEEKEHLLLAYTFLRNTEHRLQYWDDQQTQTLPEDGEQQILLAKSMGFADYTEFLLALNQHRQIVDDIFNSLLNERETPNERDDEDIKLLSKVWNHSCDREEQQQILTKFAYEDVDQILQRLADIKNSSKYRQLSPKAQKRFDLLLPQTIKYATYYQPAQLTLMRLLDFLMTIARRSAYLALLSERPEALEQLAKMMSLSEWMTQYLMRHPILIDDLLNQQLLTKKINWSEAHQELQQKLACCGADVEAQMDTVRQFQHACVFRLAAQDLAGMWTVEQLSDELSLLTDIILTTAMQQVWQNYNKKHRQEPQFIIIGYGKLGGKELGFSSDLDLVYLYQDDAADAVSIYTRFANRLTTFLTMPTGAGMLYEVDLRLRPNGDSGFVVQSLEMFKRYQYESAWTWEQQALSRARYICGDTQIGVQFEAIRGDILMQARDLNALKAEIITMREKMYPTHPPVDTNVKYAHGGVVDVEFIVQYLVLAFAYQYEDLTYNLGNIALLKIAANHGLIDRDLAEKVGSAYRQYRKIQHNIKLLGQDTFILSDELKQCYQQVRLLWQAVFNHIKE